MGIVFQVHMEDLKRMLHLVPPVSVVTYYEDEVQPRKQILDQLGFALRLTGTQLETTCWSTGRSIMRPIRIFF